jgi:hypothetical protein
MVKHRDAEARVDRRIGERDRSAAAVEPTPSRKILTAEGKKTPGHVHTDERMTSLERGP